VAAEVRFPVRGARAMNPTATEIAESDAWKQMLSQLDLQLWNEFKRAKLNDTEELLKVQARRWALDVIRSELERELPKRSINLQKSHQ
jgi:glutamate formiminotransferase